MPKQDSIKPFVKPSWLAGPSATSALHHDVLSYSLWEMRRVTRGGTVCIAGASTRRVRGPSFSSSDPFQALTATQRHIEWEELITQQVEAPARISMLHHPAALLGRYLAAADL